MSNSPRKPVSRAKGSARTSTKTTTGTKDRWRATRWLLRLGWLLPLVALGVGGAVLFLTYAFANIPLPREVPLPSAAEVYDANGDLIGVFSGEERRFLINTEKLIKNRDTAFIGEAVISAAPSHSRA